MQYTKTKIGCATKSQIVQLFERACRIAEDFKEADKKRARARYYNQR